MATDRSNHSIFEQSRARFLIGLTKSEAEDFKFTTSECVNEVIDKIQDEQASKREMRNMTRIRGFVEAMEQYGAVIEVFLNASQFVAFIWGPIKFLLQVARTWSESLDALLDAYEQLGETIPLLSQYESLFTSSPHMRRILGTIYIDVLEFHRRALVIFKRKAWKQIFHSAWKSFQTQFGRLLANFKENAILIDRHASLIEVEANQSTRKALENHMLEAEKAEVNRQELSVISKLSPADFELDQENASDNWAKGQSFGLWLLENSGTKAWLDPENKEAAILWIKGIPGAGKTILTSRLIAMMREMDGHDVVFFYCKDADRSRNTLTALLKGFLTQLLAVNHGVLSYIYEECVKSREVTIESLPTLKALVAISLECGRPLWLIVDGLDECETRERRKILNWILPLIKSSENQSDLRLLIVSRNEEDILKRLSKVPSLVLHDLVAHSNEIRVYTSRKLKKIRKKFALSQQDGKEIGDRINSGAKGMFIFARLMLKHLKSQTSLAELRTEVNPAQFPEGLDQVYERIVRRIYTNPMVRERNAAIMILEWIVGARRTLRWNELQAIFSVDLDAGIVDFEGRCLRPNDPESYHSTVQKLCGSLVEVLKGNTVHLVHDTAKTYLTGRHAGVAARIDSKRTEFEIVKLCLGYLSLPIFSDRLEDGQINHYLTTGNYGFEDYAIRYWLDHLDTFVESVGHYEIDSLRIISLALDKFLGTYGENVPHPRMLSEEYSVEGLCSHLTAQRVYLHKKSKLDIRNSQSNKGLKCEKALALQLARRRGLFEAVVRQLQDNKTRDNLALFYGPSTGWYKCSTLKCFGFWEGFPNDTARQQHIQKHDRPFRCLSTGCPYGSLGFCAYAELERHVSGSHSITQSNITFPSPNTQALEEQDPSQVTVEKPGHDDQIAYKDGSISSIFEEVGNKLGELDLGALPSELKKTGEDWFTINTPAQEGSIAVELLSTLQLECVVSYAIFNTDTSLVAICGNGLIGIYQTLNGNLLHHIEVPRPSEDHEIENYVRSMAFSPVDDRVLVSGGEDNLVRLWKIGTEGVTLMHSFVGHEDDVYSIAFASNGRIASSSGDRTVRIWSSITFACEGVFTTIGKTSCVAFSPDENLVAAGSLNKRIYVWEVTTMLPIYQVHEPGQHIDSTYSITFAPDSYHLYSASLDNLIKVWTLDGTCIKTMDGLLNFGLSVAITPDNKLLFCGSKDRGVHIYNAETGKIRCLLQGHRNSVISVNVGNNSTERSGIFVSASGDKTARLWSYQTIV